MKIFLLFLILITSHYLSHSQVQCEKYNKDYIPVNIIDALNFLNCEWSADEKNQFKSKDEENAVAELHFGTGQAIRNEWGLWAKKKNSLRREFNRKGIFHPDDMSSIILSSFHRMLNNKSIDIEQQIINYKNYWDKKEVHKKRLKIVFRDFKIGDTIKIPYARSFGFDGTESTSLHAWYNGTNETKFDCIISGVIVGKSNRKKKYNLLYRVLNTDLCPFQKIYIDKNEVIAGEIFEHDMKYLKILGH